MNSEIEEELDRTIRAIELFKKDLHGDEYWRVLLNTMVTSLKAQKYIIELERKRKGESI